jgi:hypothetical protein
VRVELNRLQDIRQHAALVREDVAVYVDEQRLRDRLASALIVRVDENLRRGAALIDVELGTITRHHEGRRVRLQRKRELRAAENCAADQSRDGGVVRHC